jgi:hypothetical protein
MADNTVMQNILTAQQVNENRAKAQVELAQLKNDKEWIAKYMAGSVDHVRKMTELTTAISAEAPKAPGGW